MTIGGDQNPANLTRGGDTLGGDHIDIIALAQVHFRSLAHAGAGSGDRTTKW